jgi:hypothetical protein
MLVALMGLTAFSPPRQPTSSPVTIDAVFPGYDSYFRENDWMPLLVRISNHGSDMVGRLVVRPETSGSAVTNTYSVPITLPAGSDKSAFIYITARSLAQTLRVEFLDNEDLVYASSDVAVRPVLPQDLLYAVITTSTAGSIDLSGVTLGDSKAFQANWQVENIPDKPDALAALDLLMFTDVDSGPLTPDQRQAISSWVAAGGHLIVTGGPNWQATAAGLTDLLPLIPKGNQTIKDVSSLSALTGQNQTLPGEALVATGDLQPNALILAQADNIPLIARRFYGAGTVDYLALDPNTTPLRGWKGLNDLWFTLGTTVNPRPSWSRGFNDWDEATNAIQTLPGVNLLPQVLALCFFLGAYIALVGPVNYLILARFNRREWAWVTIPVLIVVFSVAAYVFGFNLRGNEVTLSELSVVQSWHDLDQARIDQLVGLLSPRRANYSLAVTDSRLLRPVPQSALGGLFANSPTESNTDIRQTNVFNANNFPVDASFIASFSASGALLKPAISGRATLTYAPDGKMQNIRGSVRNDSDQTLSDPVILVRGYALRLDKPLKPGDVATFQHDEVLLSGEGQAAPAALEAPFDVTNSITYGFRASSQLNTDQTATDILGEDVFDALARNRAFPTTTEQQEAERRQSFLRSFILDQFGSTSRGNRAYLVGWSDSNPAAFEVQGANWHTQDTTLYIVDLQVDFTPPAQTVTVSADQFMWVTKQRSGLASFNGPSRIRLTPGDEVIFRFTPLPNAVLSRVNEVALLFDQASTFRRIPLQIWDWQAQSWVDIETDQERFTISSPAKYLGPQNSVQIRLYLDAAGGYLDIGSIAVEETGRF